MKVLYLHGLGSRDFISHQNSEKVLIIKRIYGDVISPVYDYTPEDIEKTNVIFNQLSKIIEDENIGLVIGNSYGGYLSFWLGIKNNIKSISFNPPLGKFFNLLDYSNTNKKNIFLSKEDSVVPYKNTLSFLNNIGKNSNTYIHLIEGGHLIDLHLFEKCLNHLKTIDLKSTF